MASVKWSNEALQNLDALDSLIRARMLSKVSWLKENFADITPEPLRRELKGLYKLRIGDYRIAYSVRGDVIAIEMVGHRRDIYR